MEVDTRQRQEGARFSSAASSIARVPRRIGARTVAAALACGMVAIAALALSMQGSDDVHAAATAAADRPANAEAVRPLGLQASVTWLDGIASGLVLPSDVTSRLAPQDTPMARAVMAAWTDLDRSGDAIALERKLGWVDGLAAGLIRRSDVVSRLAPRDPGMAKAVLAAWSDLKHGRSADDAAQG